MELLDVRRLLAADVVINEIHYDPPDKTQRAEFIELFNNSDAAVDLSGWYLADGVDYEFPSGAALEARGYVVVAEDPATAKSLFHVDAFGPWGGQLKNGGERIELRDAEGGEVDRVDYQLGFPWPTVGDAPGNSIELIHPDLDNDLGGNWRRGGAVDALPRPLLAASDSWSYLPGEREPAAAWRDVGFDDSDWPVGPAPIGYGDGHVATVLAMRNNFSTVYLRRTFTVDDLDALGRLRLRAQYDDGFNLGINGRLLASDNVAGSELPFNATARSALENMEFVEFNLPTPSDFLVVGTNVIAVQLLNASLGGSSDAWFAAELAVEVGGGLSPGAANFVLSAAAPPAVRQVSHGEASMISGQDVKVTAKATDPDGVQTVELEYQVVAPGDYFGRYLKSLPNGEPVLNPRYDDPGEWTTLSMHDDGKAGDDAAGDDVFTALIPGVVNQHRHLVRYRIRVADATGAGVRVPYQDDARHNFAYFVYDGVPDWTGAVRPGVDPAVTYELDQLRPLAAYHLLTTREDYEDAQHVPDAATASYGGDEYLWTGALVYDGQVYDNIRYRARGGVWRYAMGKNMWKFDFNRGDGFQARDDYGRPHEEKWDKLNFSAIIQQGNYLHRGEQGLFESVGFKLFNLAGVESPATHYVQFRIIDDPDETGPDQHSGDFQGLYLAVEQPDGNFLESHGLPDGNLYKIENHTGTSSNQGPSQVSDGSDVAAFIAGYRGRDPAPDWWREHLDLEKYFSYRVIVEGIHHYDIAYGKNYYYYLNPDTNRFEIHPWDLDLTWADNMYGSGAHDFAVKVAGNDAFRVEYENRIRELTDLLYNEEQTGLLIDEFAALVSTPDAPSWVDADRAMWDYNPILASSYVNPSKAGQGRFYEQSTTDDFAGMVQLMKNYVRARARRFQRMLATDQAAPQTPTLQYVGQPDFPINALSFRTSDFADPQGAETFAAMQWRVAEITDPENPDLGGAAPPKYEINSTSESGTWDDFQSQWSPPAEVLTPGALYRARVRMQDAEGHWSHWSDPVQFTAGAALPSGLADALRISEIHFHPGAPSAAEQQAGFVDADEFEFLELINVGNRTIDLSRVSLLETPVGEGLEGVNFAFSTAAITELAPGERVLVVENVAAFDFRYGAGLPVAGQWSGKLSNAGEKLTLTDDGAVVQEFRFDDGWYDQADGEGYSLEAVAPSSPNLGDWERAAGWLPSVRVGGSPGASRVLGDLDGDLRVASRDIDLLLAALAAPSPSDFLDLDGDRRLTRADVDFLVRDVLDAFYGDVNLDGQVTFGDFLVLSENFGRGNASWSLGDFDGDGTVRFDDFLVLADSFGSNRDLRG